MKASTIFKIIISAVIAIALAFSIAWFSFNAKSIFSGVSLYTAQEMQEAVDESFSKGLITGQGSLSHYQSLLSSTRDALDAAESELAVLKQTISQLEQANAGNETLVALLQAQIVTLNSTVASLELQQQILESLLSDYQNVDKLEVIFMLDESTLFSTALVEPGSVAPAPIPPNSERWHFVGWSLDSVAVIDLSAYPIVEDTTFYAIATNPSLFDVNFVILDRDTPAFPPSTLLVIENLVGFPLELDKNDFRITFLYDFYDNGNRIGGTFEVFLDTYDKPIYAFNNLIEVHLQADYHVGKYVPALFIKGLYNFGPVIFDPSFYYLEILSIELI